MMPLTSWSPSAIKPPLPPHLSDAQIGRLHGTIGLHLGARTPAGIAVAIVAEIVAVKKGAGPKHMMLDAVLPANNSACTR